MKVKELILQCPLEEIAQEVMKIQEISDENFDNVVTRYKEFLQDLASRQEIESDQLILASTYHLGDEIRINPTLYPMEDLEIWKNSADFLADFPDEAEIDNLSQDELEEYIQNTKLPEGFSFMFVPWNEVLGFRVHEINVKKVGLVPFAAALLHEMSFFGLDEDEMEKEKAELDESFAEYEEIKKLPEEEQAKHFHSHDEIFASYGINTQRSFEEKEAFRLKTCREHLINRKNIYLDLREIL